MKVCKECKIEFEPDNSKAMFCSAKCRQKDYRKSVAAKLRELKEVKLQDLTKNNAVASIEPQGEAKSNYSINTTETSNIVPNRPQRLPGEDAIDYAGRLNEWKRLNK